MQFIANETLWYCTQKKYIYIYTVTAQAILSVNNVTVTKINLFTILLNPHGPTESLFYLLAFIFFPCPTSKFL